MHISKYTEDKLLYKIILLVSAKRTLPLANYPFRHNTVQHSTYPSTYLLQSVIPEVSISSFLCL